MRLSGSTYRKFSVVALIVLLVLPCSVRKEIQHWLNVDFSQVGTPSANSPKTCVLNSSSCTFTQTHSELKSMRQVLPFENDGSPDLANPLVSGETYVLSDSYNRYKEKIPSFLRFGQFLI